ncbi:RdgB/HAM1 family non-canonical purine NTP pyrophosphatase [Pseudahrensia aquimaris]|uniref:dITP/XTP pyrophosphatase n=1 Tax=Pseudahrensia aquimaris TaxID=744461 RepID=A0ABW3FEP2_9HYPH
MRKLETREIIVATHNDGKLREIRQLLEPYGFKITSAGEQDLPEPEENGTTFEENAFTKAWAAASATGMVALSDDSGLSVDTLGGAPGVYTADWAEKDDGSGRDFMMAMEKVEAALAEKAATKPAERKAQFNAVLCLCWPDGHAEYFKGIAPGVLVWPPRGDDGFGYDPVFLPDGHKRTFGEMTAEEKHSWTPGQKEEPLSHRARAFAKLANALLPDTLPS